MYIFELLLFPFIHECWSLWLTNMLFPKQWLTRVGPGTPMDSRDGNWSGSVRILVYPYPHPFIISKPLPAPLPVGYPIPFIISKPVPAPLPAGYPINIIHRCFGFTRGYRLSKIEYYMDKMALLKLSHTKIYRQNKGNTLRYSRFLKVKENEYRIKRFNIFE